MSRVTRPASAASEAAHDDRGARALLAERLRLLRLRRRLSLSDVALGTGLSRSFLALLESGESDVSVSRLLRVAEFYGVWLSDLVGTLAPAVEVVRASDTATVRSDDEAVVTLLSTHSVRLMMPFRVELPPGAHLEGGLSHSGEEFVHVVAGEVELEILDAGHVLATGDTASFPGRLPHSYRNRGDQAAVIVGATARAG